MGWMGSDETNELLNQTTWVLYGCTEQMLLSLNAFSLSWALVWSNLPYCSVNMHKLFGNGTKRRSQNWTKTLVLGRRYSSKGVIKWLELLVILHHWSFFWFISNGYYVEAMKNQIFTRNDVFRWISLTRGFKLEKIMTCHQERKAVLRCFRSLIVHVGDWAPIPQGTLRRTSR